ncbi:kinase-like domain-containing protein, partial [Mucor mucedo]|uniref:kinase-like domain-containing protein n=1 Tax=Mucor mucedo TaxID=29922 RepID=UPI00221E446C
MNTVYDITVTEYPIVVKDSIDESWKTVPEFNITVKTTQYKLYVIRYIPDLFSFDHLVKTHYPKIKIPFPSLTESLSKSEKRKSLRNFFHLSIKSNAEKVEKYLYRCALDPVLSASTLLRDFLSPQRDGDEKSHAYPSPSQSYDQIGSTPNDNVIDSSIEIGKVWVPSPHPSVINNTDIDGFEYEFPLENLEMVKVLGKGCMGKHVIEQREITHTLDERNILTKLSELDHPYLAKLHTSFQDEHRLYLLTNYYCGGDLATHMAKLYSFPKECALFYAAEIIDGIGALHSLGILYRDLKPENILLTGDGHIILTDFGLSKWLTAADNYTTQTFCGTAEYLAPEVLLGDSYSFGIDHWSFGTILYEMLAGITPFWADNHADMYRRVLEDPLEFPADIFDYETAEFISDILDRDPRTRLGAQSVDDIKDHVYFADISWDDIRNRRLHPPYLPPVQNELDFTNFDPDFLAMTPQLTPISSEIDFAEDIQDIFDGYSFTNEKYLDYEQV